MKDLIGKIAVCKLKSAADREYVRVIDLHESMIQLQGFNSDLEITYERHDEMGWTLSPHTWYHLSELSWIKEASEGHLTAVRQIMEARVERNKKKSNASR